MPSSDLLPPRARARDSRRESDGARETQRRARYSRIIHDERRRTRRRTAAIQSSAQQCSGQRGGRRLGWWAFAVGSPSLLAHTDKRTPPQIIMLALLLVTAALAAAAEVAIDGATDDAHESPNDDPPWPGPPVPPAQSQHCATSAIVGNWTGKIDGMWVRMEIVPLGGRRFGMRGPSNSRYDPCGQNCDPSSPTARISVGSVRPDGSIFLNCSKPHWCHFSHTTGKPGNWTTFIIDSQVVVFSSWQPPQLPKAQHPSAGVNCSQLTMMANYTTLLPSWAFGYGEWDGRFCKHAVDPTCPTPPGMPGSV